MVGPIDREPRETEPPRVSNTGLILVLTGLGLLLLLACAGVGVGSLLVWSNQKNEAARQAAFAAEQEAVRDVNRFGLPANPRPGRNDPIPPPRGFAEFEEQHRKIVEESEQRARELREQMDRQARQMQEDIARGIPPRGLAGGANATRPAVLPKMPPTLPILAPTLPEDPHSIPIDGRISQLASGGGGRFLVLLIEGHRRIDVFDCNALKVTTSIDGIEPGAWIAAGMTRTVVFSGGKLRCYSLLTGEREREADFTPEGELVSFCMGSASDGPLLIAAGAKLSRRLTFVDIRTLERMTIPASGFGVDTAPTDTFFPAANGRVFGCHWGIGSNLQLSCVTITEGVLHRHRQIHHTNFVAPFADGLHVATGGRGILTTQLAAVPDAVFSEAGAGIHLKHLFVPAQSGPFYMHVQMNADPFHRASKLEEVPGTIVIYALGHRQPLLTLRGLPTPRAEEMAAYREIGLPRGVHLLPAANLLAIVPPSRDRLVCYRADVFGALQQSGADYLYVDSHPPASAKRGEPLHYAIAARSRGGQVTHVLEAAPPGMAVTPQGVVQWTPPPDFREIQTRVVVSIQQPGGKSLRHEFTLIMED